MQIIITDNLNVPLCLYKNSTIWSVRKFEYYCDNSVKGFNENDIIYCDVSTLTNDVYDNIKIKNINVNFYFVENTNTPNFFITDYIETYKEDDCIVLSKNNIDISFLYKGNTLILGDTRSGKTVLVNKLIEQLLKDDCVIEILSKKGSFDYSEYGEIDRTLENIMNSLVNFKKEIDNRLELLKFYGVDDISEIHNGTLDYLQKIIFIDNLESLLDNATIEQSAIIYDILSHFTKYSKKVGITFIGITSSPAYVLPLKNTIDNFIIGHNTKNMSKICDCFPQIDVFLPNFYFSYATKYSQLRLLVI